MPLSSQTLHLLGGARSLRFGVLASGGAVALVKTLGGEVAFESRSLQRWI